MKSKLLVVAVSAAVLMGGCAHQTVKEQHHPFEDYDEVHPREEQKAPAPLVNKKIYYNGVDINSRYAMGVTPSSNFYLGAGPGVNSYGSMRFKTPEAFASERETTLRQLCERKFGSENQRKISHVVDRNVEVCSINYEADIPLRSVYFRTGSTYLNPAFYPMLDYVVELMNKNKDSTLRVTGFTDSAGNIEINKEISKGRAQVVKDYFVKRGIPEKRVSVSSRAKSEYLLDNSETLNRAVNRRAEMVFNFNLPNFPE